MEPSMITLLKQPISRFLAKFLVFLMVINGIPWWELSKHYQFNLRLPSFLRIATAEAQTCDQQYTHTSYTGEYIFQANDYTAMYPTSDVTLTAITTSGALPVTGSMEVIFTILNQEGAIVRSETTTTDIEGNAQVTSNKIPVGVYTIHTQFI